MDLNIPELVAKLLAETKDQLLKLAAETVGEVPAVVEAVNSYIANAQSRMTSLLGYMAGGGDVKFLLDRLQEEKDILQSEVLSFIVISKGIAQNIINSVQDILLQFISQVLPTQSAE